MKYYYSYQEVDDAYEKNGFEGLKNVKLYTEDEFNSLPETLQDRLCGCYDYVMCSFKTKDYDNIKDVYEDLISNYSISLYEVSHDC